MDLRASSSGASLARSDVPPTSRLTIDAETECLLLSVDEPQSFEWLPDSCAYRRLANGKDLPEWHPLLTGDPNSVHDAGISVRGNAVSENETTEYTVLRQMSDFDE